MMFNRLAVVVSGILFVSSFGASIGQAQTLPVTAGFGTSASTSKPVPVLPSSDPLQQLPAFTPVVIVNDDIITAYDIDQKVRLLAVSNNQPVSQAMQSIAVRALIDDKLKQQAAQRIGIEITKEDMDSALQSIARKNNQDITALQTDLARDGITIETLKAQLKAEVAWNRFIQQRFGNRVRPSESDIEKEMTRLSEENALTYNLAQVLVPLSPTAVEPDVKAAYENALNVQRDIAQRSSGCTSVETFKATYDKSGRLPNAVPARALPPAIQQALVSLADNVPSNPVRSEEGFHVIVICSRQEDKTFSPSEDQVRQQVLASGFERFAKSYLQDLRRDAIIEQR